MSSESLQLSQSLAEHVAALTAQHPDAAAVTAAQRRLEGILDVQRPRRRRRHALAWAGAGLAGAVVATVLLVAPTLFGGGGGGAAFAAVQKRLRDFQTLAMVITQRAGGLDLPTIRVWADRRGNARTDIGDATSVIVNVDSGKVLTLLHAGHTAMLASLPEQVRPGSGDALNWLQKISAFKGRAAPLPGRRVIDGHTVHGWALDMQGIRVELWADDDDVPRAVDISGSVSYSQRMRLTIDPPLDPSRFSVMPPPGYTLATED